jgi:PhnB protein
MRVDPYLNFNGKCDEAIEFYKSALGAKVNMLMRFKDMPEACPPGMDPAVANKVMHADLSIGNSKVLLSDGRCQGHTKFEGVSLSLSASSDAECKMLFGALADGGKVEMPLAKTFFASSFGMVFERFGVMWMVITQA